jgi:hypothetical protein
MQSEFNQSKCLYSVYTVCLVKFGSVCGPLLRQPEDHNSQSSLETKTTSLRRGIDWRPLLQMPDAVSCFSLQRQLTIGNETAFEWHNVPTVVKTVLGSSQHVTSASEHMIVKLIRRVFEIKQSCRCWRNYDSASGPCSRTVLLGNTWYVRSRKAKRPNEQALLVRMHRAIVHVPCLQACVVFGRCGACYSECRLIFAVLAIKPKAV